LQAIVHQRYKRHRAMVITSNRVVQDWGKYLADATMATTILDRLDAPLRDAGVRGQELQAQGGGGWISRRDWPSTLKRHNLAAAAWGNLGWPRVGEFGLAIRATFTTAPCVHLKAGALLASNAKLEGVWRDYWHRASASSFALQPGAESRPGAEGRRKAVAVVGDEAQAPLL
jgi:hypothetical protein